MTVLKSVETKFTPINKILVTGLNSVYGWNLFLESARRAEAFGTFRNKRCLFKSKNLFRTNLDKESEIYELVERIQPECIIHSRGICDMDLCEMSPELAEEINVRGTEKILRAAKAWHVKRFVYMSTDHVFFGRRGNYSERDEPRPKHVFGKSKLKAERLVRDSGLSFLIIRPGMVLGSSVQGNIGSRDFLISRLKSNRPISLFVDEWRTPIRAEALARRVLNLIFSGETGLFHVAGRRAYSRYEIGKLIAKEEGLSTRMIVPKKRADDVWSHIRPNKLTLTSVYQSRDHDSESELFL